MAQEPSASRRLLRSVKLQMRSRVSSQTWMQSEWDSFRGEQFGTQTFPSYNHLRANSSAYASLFRMGLGVIRLLKTSCLGIYIYTETYLTGHLRLVKKEAPRRNHGGLGAMNVCMHLSAHLRVLEKWTSHLGLLSISELRTITFTPTTWRTLGTSASSTQRGFAVHALPLQPWSPSTQPQHP